MLIMYVRIFMILFYYTISFHFHSLSFKSLNFFEEKENILFSENILIDII